LRAPHPFHIERGIGLLAFHREKTIGRRSPKNLVGADAAFAAISSQELPAGLNSEAQSPTSSTSQPRDQQAPTSLATSKRPPTTKPAKHPTLSPAPALRPAMPVRAKFTSLAASKSKAPERGPNVQSPPAT
jgi:hypothetical protein